MKAFVSLTLMSALVWFAACTNGNSKPSFLFKPAPKEGIAGKVGDMEITNAELMDGIESELFEAESKVFEIKFNRFKSLLFSLQ